MNKFALAFALVATLGASAPRVQAQLLPTDTIDRIVAVVDEDVILQSELDRSVNQVLTQYQRNPQQLPPRDVLQRQVLDRLIMGRLQVAKADQTGVRVSDGELDQAVTTVAQQNKMDVDQLRGAIARDGLSYDEFRHNLRDEMLQQRLRQRVTQSSQATDAEIDIMLASNSLKTGEVRLSHILVGVPDGATADQLQTARDKAEKVKKEIDGGLDFNAAAIRYSDAPDALEGGDLGWRSYDQVPSMFGDLLQGMQKGQVSPAVRGPSGFHILKLADQREQGKQVVTEFHARHVMIKVTELVSSAEAEKKVRALRERIVDGKEDFAKIAKASSQDNTSANNGGDMGWFPIDSFGPQVAEVISGLKDDEVSEPFHSNVGWHFVQRLGMRQEDKTNDARRAQARDAIHQRKAEEDYDNFLRQIRSEAFVEYRLPGFKPDGTALQGTAPASAP
ncbi:MAG: peptidylprolyl isomerase [Tahibacter sp.]